MTIVSKLQSSKEADALAANGLSTEPPREEIRAVLLVKTAESRRRQHHHHAATIRQNSNFILFILALLMVDVITIMNTDVRNPGPLMKMTRFDPTFNLYMMIALHMMTLFGGLSKTVNGCRLAMAVAWMTCMGVLVFAILFPAFMGSYVASGICDLKNSTHCEEMPAERRFNDGYETGVASQMLVVFMLMGCVYQVQLIDKLLVEAHELENAIFLARETAAQGGETGAGAADAFFPEQ